MKDFAVFLVTYNSSKDFLGCITSMKKNKSATYDVYVLDNNSQDDTPELIKKNIRKERYILASTNTGYAGGHNKLLKYIDLKKYRYILFLNPDTRVAPDLFTELKKAFVDHSHAGIVSPAIVDYDNTIDSIGGKYLFWTGTTMGNRYGEKYKKSNDLYQCFWASGAALAIRTDVIKKLGGFENYFMFYEDVDLAWRVHSAGYNVLATAKTYVKHKQGGSTSDRSWALHLNERNRIICHYQNLSPITFYLCLPLLLVARILLLKNYASNSKTIFAKLRGLRDAFLMLPSYKRHSNVDLQKEWGTILSMLKCDTVA